MTPARAQAPGAGPGTLASSPLSDLAAWWMEDGRAGWTPGADAGTGYLWTIAGLTRGAWTLDSPGRAPQGLPYPGVASANPPPCWDDTLEFSLGEGGAWEGYGATLASARGISRPLPDRRALAVFTLMNGPAAADRYGLTVERGDRRHWLRAETMSARRDALGSLGAEGRHLWGLAGGMERGRHTFEAAYADRGEATSVAGDLYDESSRGESGRAEYRYSSERLNAALALARGYDRRVSFGPLTPFSRRDAQEDRIAGEIATPRGGREVGARLEWRTGEVRRAGLQSFSRRASSLWLAMRYLMPLAAGRLEATLGAGRHDAFSRTEVAPSLSYHVAQQRVSGGLMLERLIDPVWADLDTFTTRQQPFLQSTWVAGLVASAGPEEGTHAAAQLLAGRTHDRALITRYPITDIALRLGFRRESQPWDFGLFTANLAWRGPSFGLFAEGYTLARGRGQDQPQVDPGFGGRAGGEWRFKAFKGDLGITLRALAAAVGPRESEYPTLPRAEGYVTLGADADLSLADVTIAIQGRNLEDREHQETWPDPLSGAPAQGPRRQIRVAASWRFYN